MRPGVQQLEIVPQRKLHAARFSGSEDLAEEGTEIRIGSRNAPIGMVEGIERLRAKLNGVAFAHAEPAIQGEVEDVVSRTGNGIAAGIAECERGRGREGIG